jgi:hypothetical protein
MFLFKALVWLWQGGHDTIVSASATALTKEIRSLHITLSHSAQLCFIYSSLACQRAHGGKRVRRRAMWIQVGRAVSEWEQEPVI